MKFGTLLSQFLRVSFLLFYNIDVCARLHAWLFIQLWLTTLLIVFDCPTVGRAPD